jgi:hypothetical protein
MNPLIERFNQTNLLMLSQKRQSFSISPPIPGQLYQISEAGSPILSSETRMFTKRKNLLEMMGFPRNDRNIVKSLSPETKNKSQKISLTDFMGSRRQSFLKKSGFSDIHEHCLKLKHQKILSSKPGSNIDLKQVKQRNPSLEKLSNEKDGKSQKNYLNGECRDLNLKLKRVKQLEDIIKKCNEIHASTKIHRAPSINDATVPKRTNKKRLSHIEKKTILNEIYKL